MDINEMSKSIVTSALSEVLNRRNGSLNEQIRLKRNVIDDPLDVITLSIFQETIRSAIKNKEKTIKWDMLFKVEPKKLNSLILKGMGFSFDAKSYFRDDGTISLRDLSMLIDSLFNSYAHYLNSEVVRERDKIAKWFY